MFKISIICKHCGARLDFEEEEKKLLGIVAVACGKCGFVFDWEYVPPVDL